MSYRLRDGITFCRTGDRFVFLDLPNDRYFCLAPATDRAFARLVESEAASGEKPHIGALLCKGLLVAAGENGLRPCALPCKPTASLVDELEAPPRWRHVIEALISRAAARLRLAAFGLNRTLHREIKAKDQMAQGDSDSNGSLVAAALAKSARVFHARNQCLCTSLAAISMLRARNVTAFIIVGVKLRPFQAHCWVQVGNSVVTDRLDVVRNFTPIWVG